MAIIAETTLGFEEWTVNYLLYLQKVVFEQTISYLSHEIRL